MTMPKKSSKGNIVKVSLYNTFKLMRLIESCRWSIWDSAGDKSWHMFRVSRGKPSPARFVLKMDTFLKYRFLYLVWTDELSWLSVMVAAKDSMFVCHCTWCTVFVFLCAVWVLDQWSSEVLFLVILSWILLPWNLSMECFGVSPCKHLKHLCRSMKMCTFFQGGGFSKGC